MAYIDNTVITRELVLQKLENARVYLRLSAGHIGYIAGEDVLKHVIAVIEEEAKYQRSRLAYEIYLTMPREASVSND